MSNDHECYQTDKFEEHARFTGKVDEAVNSMKEDINALFILNRESSKASDEQNKEILKAVGDLKLSSTVDMKELKIKYGFFGSLIAILSTGITLLSVWLIKKF